MRSPRIVFIHIGKCGGTSIDRALLIKKICFEKKHMCQIEYDDTKKYIISIRNPISRFVSAFNWRKKLVCGTLEQKDRFEGEKDFLEKYKSVNDLAEAIYDSQGVLQLDLSLRENYIHHIKEDINYYLGDFVDRCKKHSIIAILAQETLSEDFDRFFGGGLLLHHLHRNKVDDSLKKLSELGYSNLKKYLEKDYNCIKRLHQLGLLSKEKYAILMK